MSEKLNKFPRNGKSKFEGLQTIERNAKLLNLDYFVFLFIYYLICRHGFKLIYDGFKLIVMQLLEINIVIII